MIRSQIYAIMGLSFGQLAATFQLGLGLLPVLYTPAAGPTPHSYGTLRWQGNHAKLGENKDPGAR